MLNLFTGGPNPCAVVSPPDRNTDDVLPYKSRVICCHGMCQFFAKPGFHERSRTQVCLAELTRNNPGNNEFACCLIFLIDLHTYME